MATEYKLSYTAKEIDEKLGQIAQSDWAVNDENSGAYVKNRTHWIEKDIAELFPETTLECNENGEGAIFQPIGLKEGETYTVVWNGTEYECVAANLTTVIGVPCVAVGDWKLITTEGAETTGEPFLIAELSPEAAAEMGANAKLMALDGSTAPIMSIHGSTSIYHKLDKRFMPDGVPYITRENIYNDTLILTGNQTIFEDVKIGLIAGETYFVNWNGVEYKCVAETYQEANIYIGDPSTSAMPFSIMENTEMMGIVTSDGSTTVEIIIDKADINRISVDCFPKEIFSLSVGVSTGENAGEIFNNYSENKAEGDYSHAEGTSTTASGGCSHAEGMYTIASGGCSHAEGRDVIASGDYSHAEGLKTVASGNYSHVQGKYNIEDVENIYAHIVGNGRSGYRSNAHTLDWGGNAWYAGTVESRALILKSPNGTRFKITVDNSGNLSATAITE